MEIEDRNIFFITSILCVFQGLLQKFFPDNEGEGALFDFAGQPGVEVEELEHGAFCFLEGELGQFEF